MRLSRIAAALVFASLMTALPALADEAQEIGKLLKSGQQAQAMERADKFLATNPKDAQVRFLKGLIFTEQNKTAEAIRVFTSLTEDYPELPEPYNNLAVLYASQNQLDKARAALQMAIQTNPAYATAHENLGDLYAKMASQAYDRALQLDKGNNAAQTKLSLVRELFSRNRVGTAKPITLAQANPAQAPVVPVVKPNLPVSAVPVVPATAKPAATTPIAAPVTPVITKPLTTAPVATQTLAKPIEKPADKPGNKSDERDDDAEEQVQKSVNAWAKAWEGKKVSAYLAAYAKGFKTPKGESRSDWEQQRRERISGAKSIDVSLSGVKIKVDGDQATVRFTQNYRSDSLKSSTGKTLIMIRSGKTWQIKEERVG